MARRPWWPSTLADQSSLMQSFRSKIGGYASQLAFTPAQVTDAQTLCTTFINAYNFAEAARLAMQGATQWRDLVFFGEPVGGDAPPTPAFPSGGDFEFTRGVVNRFFSLRDQIVANNGYTLAMGEDLGLIGPENPSRPAGEVAPVLKATVSMGNFVNLTGSMQGMDALRVEYSKQGGEFTTIAFLTKTPGGFQVTPSNPNQPENGFIRAVFIKKNEEFGNFSPNYPVTVS